MKSGKNFTRLNDLIQESYDEIILDSDYALNDSEIETFKDGIKISRDIRIDGRGHSIDAGGKARIFDIAASRVTLKNITFKNADTKAGGGAIVNKMVLNLIDSRFVGCVCDGIFGGGAIYNWGGFIIVDGCEFDSNMAFDDYSGAGAISNTGKAIIMDCVFTQNRALGDYGGGAIVNSGSMKITRSRFIKNHAEYRGGALSNDKGELTIEDCEFSDNSASRGGAVFSKNSNLAMSGCTYGRNVPDNVSKPL